MALKKISKRIMMVNPPLWNENITIEEVKNTLPTNKNKKEKKDVDMTIEQMEKAENLVQKVNAVKVVKKDKGLIERTESSKIVLTEDNRQVLND